MPKISILLPNYNNGPEASLDGSFHFLQHLFTSFYRTLDGFTDYEFIVVDDGSTDSSLEYLRMLSKAGKIKLLEQPHRGLATTSNTLVKESTSPICVRVDGDITFETKGWIQKVLQFFELAPKDVGIIGPKQLGIHGRTHAYGNFIIHPKGFHNVGQGWPKEVFKEVMEVDDVMGCFYIFKREVWEKIGGFDEENFAYKRGQTVDFSLRARLAGYRILVLPHIEFMHHHARRKPRQTYADTPEGIYEAYEVFFKKWGFHLLWPDLDVVKEKYKGTPLLWNMKYMIDTYSYDKYQKRGPIHWQLYYNKKEPSFINRSMEIVKWVKSFAKESFILDAGCGDGIYSHLLAMEGYRVVGFDNNVYGIKLAKKLTENIHYKNAPQFFVADIKNIPFPSSSFSAVLLFDVLEHLQNPVKVLHEIKRVLKEGGYLFIVTPLEQPFVSHDPLYHVVEYSPVHLEWNLRYAIKFSDVTLSIIGEDIFCLCKK